MIDGKKKKKLNTFTSHVLNLLTAFTVSTKHVFPKHFVNLRRLQGFENKQI